MGLDMYLYAERYVGGWDHSTPTEKRKFAAIRKAVGLTPTPNSPSFHVRATIGYWRKANAIHKWFVDTVQKGTDDCGTYYVSREQLTQLQTLCRQALDAAGEKPGLVQTGTTLKPNHPLPIIERRMGTVAANPEAAAAILPTTSGFFFGSTSYDEFYLSDLKDTITIIDNALTLKDVDFYYRSSW